MTRALPAPGALLDRPRAPWADRPGRVLRTASIVGLVGSDVLALALAVGLAFVGRQAILGPAADLGTQVEDSLLVIGVAWVLAILLLGGYEPRLLPAGPELISTAVQGGLAAAGLVGGAVYLAGIELSRVFFVLVTVLGILLLVTGRVTVRRVFNGLRARGMLRERVLAVGSIDQIDAVARTVHRETWLGYDVVGAVGPARAGAERTGLDVPVLGREEDLARIVQRVRPDILLFASGAQSRAEEFRRTAWMLEGVDVEVIVVPALSEISADRVRMRPVAGLPLVHLDLPRARHALRGSKRSFDVMVSALLLLLVAPVMAAVALAVRAADGGPVIFRQQRIGRDGRSFEFLKFRTMVTDSESVLAELTERAAQDSGNTVMFKMRRDPRVTRPGRFLRRYSLDELPQLWNVLRGDMSLVGPRPALPGEVHGYDDDARRRLRVRPGITGLWQVSGRSDLSWEETVRLDLYYVDNWSFTQDAQILARTARAVLSSEGAY